MGDPTQGTTHGSRTSETPPVTSSVSAGYDEPRAPERGHTVAKPSDTPKARPLALAAWLTIPLLIAVVLLAAMFMAPGLKSNSEGKDPPRRTPDSEQSNPE